MKFAVGHYHRRFETRPEYIVDEQSGCWLWQKHRNKKGYGRLHLPGDVRIMAHRKFWQDRFGPVPDGQQLHHRCENPRCVNPDHLELTTAEAHGWLSSQSRWVPRSEYLRVIGLLRKAGVDPDSGGALGATLGFDDQPTRVVNTQTGEELKVTPVSSASERPLISPNKLKRFG